MDSADSTRFTAQGEDAHFSRTLSARMFTEACGCGLLGVSGSPGVGFGVGITGSGGGAEDLAFG